MSRKLAEKALKLIVEYERKDLSEIVAESKREKAEFGYIITPDECVHKVVGTMARIKGAKVVPLITEGSAFYHTHPHRVKADLSGGDVKTAITYSAEKDFDGMGVIAEGECGYWEVDRTIAKSYFDARKKITGEWSEAIDKYKEAREIGDVEAMRTCAKITRSCRARIGAITRKAREFALKPVYSVPTRGITFTPPLIPEVEKEAEALVKLLEGL